MTAIVFILLFIIVVLFVALVYMQLRLDLVRRSMDFDRGKNHAMCIAHVAHYVGNHFAAGVLNAAAEDYASPEGQHQLQVLISTKHRPGGPPVPSLWMSERADSLIEEVS